MREILYSLEKRINSLDTGRMSVRVEGTFLSHEISSLLGKRSLVLRLRKQVE